VRVLVVEDDPKVRGLLRRGLEQQSFAVAVAADGAEALWRAQESSFDAIVLDVMLPDTDGFTVCDQLRVGGGWAPILMLTALDDVQHRVRGLNAGADDYLVKPFSISELRARVRALLRRAGFDDEGPMSCADLRLDPRGHQVFRGERRVELTITEFALLSLLLQNAGQVLTRGQIFDRVWGYDFGSGSRTLEVYIGYLRRKLEEAGEPRLIHTVRGVGYVLREEP